MGRGIYRVWRITYSRVWIICSVCNICIQPLLILHRYIHTILLAIDQQLQNAFTHLIMRRCRMIANEITLSPEIKWCKVKIYHSAFNNEQNPYCMFSWFNNCPINICIEHCTLHMKKCFCRILIKYQITIYNNVFF